MKRKFGKYRFTKSKVEEFGDAWECYNEYGAWAGEVYRQVTTGSWVWINNGNSPAIPRDLIIALAAFMEQLK